VKRNLAGKGRGGEGRGGRRQEDEVHPLGGCFGNP